MYFLPRPVLTTPQRSGRSAASHQEQGPRSQRSRRPNSSRPKFEDSTTGPSHGADPASQALAAFHQDHLGQEGRRQRTPSRRRRA